MILTSLFISSPVQVVEDRRKSEKLQGSKKLSAVTSLGCPIPNLRRRRTSVATSDNTWNSNDVRSLYNGTNNRYLRGDNILVKCGGTIHRDSSTSS